MPTPTPSLRVAAAVADPFFSAPCSRCSAAACQQPRFLVDSMLGRLCRWLRALGVDAEFVETGGKQQAQQQARVQGQPQLLQTLGQQQQGQLIEAIHKAALTEVGRVLQELLLMRMCVHWQRQLGRAFTRMAALLCFRIALQEHPALPVVSRLPACLSVIHRCA